jgi:hypothetical protein
VFEMEDFTMRVTKGTSFLVDEDALIPVTGDGDEVEDPKATQEGGEVADKVTPAEPATDDAKKPEDFAAKYEELRRKSEEDIGKLKSALQKRESDLVKEKSVLEKKLDELLQSTMDEGDKKQYQQEKLAEELEAIKAERDELKIQNEQIAQFNTWREYFLDAGVSKSDLKLDGGLPELFQSGMDALRNKVKTLEGTKSVNTTPKKAVEPQAVAQSATGTPSTILTLADAAKHFAGGDLDLLFSMAERGNQKVVQVLNELDALSNK